VVNLNPLLRAESVAVVGASPKRDSFGWHVVRQLLDFGYAGRIVPINPRYDLIEGLPCLPSLSELGIPVDCAAICVGDARLEAAFAEAISAGARSAVVFGTAAGESTSGTSIGARLRELAAEFCIPLMGANCMGFFNFTDRLFLTGYPYHRSPGPGVISFITHSGSTLSAVAKNTRGMNFNYVISPGQELVVTAADYLTFVVRQPETRVVGLFLETIRDPDGFVAALEEANERDIPVVMLKVGRTEHGKRMALAHTGALAGTDAAILAIADRYRVLLVRTIEELLDTLELMASGRRYTAPGFAAITDSGGERGMMVDLAADLGLGFAELSNATLETIRDNLDPGLEPANPADLWGTGHDWQAKFRRAIDAMVADPAAGAFSFGIDFNVGSRLGPDYRRLAIETMRGTDKPVAVVGNVAAGMNPDDAAALRAEGVPVLMGAETGLLAFRHLRNYSGRLAQRELSPAPLNPAAISDHLWRRLEQPSPLNERESFAILEALGVPQVATLLAESLGEALAAADVLGYPVVMKTARPESHHKTDIGGVVAGLASRSALAEAYADVRDRLGPAVVVQPQIDLSASVELLLGMTVDAQFGPLVTVGLGGIWVETLRDAIHFLAPCSASEVVRRLPELRGYALLTGVRGRQPVDIAGFATLVERFSAGAAALAPHVAEIDINPLVATGSAFLALDALIVPASAGDSVDAASRG
jgi:acyl-CoA synthetase (NDP forming)